MADSTHPQKEPVVSAILSLFIPGLGQVYNGQIKRGAAIFVGQIVLWVILFAIFLFGGIIIAFATMGIGLFCCLPFMFTPFLINLWAAYAAYQDAKVINTGGIVRDWFS